MDVCLFATTFNKNYNPNEYQFKSSLSLESFSFVQRSYSLRVDRWFLHSHKRTNALLSRLDKLKNR